MSLHAVRIRQTLVAAAVAALFSSGVIADNDDDDGKYRWGKRNYPTGNVIFFHPDGTGANHWSAARMYFKGPDGYLNWDLLPNMALYRGHMLNNLVGTSNGGATTHAFGYRVDGLGSFGKNGLGEDAVFINGLSGYEGSIMREAANAGIPVGLVNDGHIGEPGTGCFLAEVGNRNDWQEITRQMIQGRPDLPKPDTTPWVIMGGGEADTRPSGTTLVHRNHNSERGQPGYAQTSLRTDGLDLEADWNDNGSGDTSNIIGTDDWIVIKTRAEFEALKQALADDGKYAPHVLGLFAYQDLFNDRNEEDLIAREELTDDPENHVGPLTDPAAPGSTPGFRSKASRIVLWGDVEGQPGYNPPTFKEMFEVALTILDRATKQQTKWKKWKNTGFFMVAEQEANDNFGNNNNAIGMLQALRDTDEAIGVARDYVKRNPRTLILTAADSDAGGLQVFTPYRDTVVTEAGLINTSNFSFRANPAAGKSPVDQVNVSDGLEGRGTTDASNGAKMFLAEPDRIGQTNEFSLVWPGTADYGGAILSRGDGLNAELLSTKFSARFDNIDVYRLMYATLFGKLLTYPEDPTAVER